MPVDAMRLRNFRGFREAQLELHPLTVLLGPNSSGKSSFGHALAAMAHAQRLGGDLTLTPAPGTADIPGREWPVDLGLLRDLRTRGASDRVYIGLSTPEGWVDFGFGFGSSLEGNLPDLRLTHLAHPKVLDVTQAMPGPFVGIPKGASAATTVPLDTVKSIIVSAKSQIAIQRINEQQWIEEETGSAVRAAFDGLLLDDWRPIQFQTAPGQQTGPAVNWSARAAVKELLSGLIYLRATRVRPTRGFDPRKRAEKGVGYSGEWTTSVLLEHSSEVVFRQPPSDLPIPQAQNALDREWLEWRGSLQDAVSFWLAHLGIATAATVRESPAHLLELRFVPKGMADEHDATEVGYGLSQVLPVLVAGLTMPQGATLIVDLPEAHLHPAPQAALADFFCSLALAGRRVLVETHSDVFFHRLRMRAEMNLAVRDLVGVYFLDAPRDGYCAPPRRVGLGDQEELKWPAGFLQEDWTIETQVQALREARHGAD